MHHPEAAVADPTQEDLHDTFIAYVKLSASLNLKGGSDCKACLICRAGQSAAACEDFQERPLASAGPLRSSRRLGGLNFCFSLLFSRNWGSRLEGRRCDRAEAGSKRLQANAAARTAERAPGHQGKAGDAVGLREPAL